MPALLVVVLLGLVGAGLVIGGIYVLLGLGFSLVSAGLLAFAAAAVLRTGISMNG